MINVRTKFNSILASCPACKNIFFMEVDSTTRKLEVSKNYSIFGDKIICKCGSKVNLFSFGKCLLKVDI